MEKVNIESSAVEGAAPPAEPTAQPDGKGESSSPVERELQPSTEPTAESDGDAAVEAPKEEKAPPPAEPMKEPDKEEVTKSSREKPSAGEMEGRQKYRATSEIFAGKHRHCAVGAVIPEDWPDSIVESLLSQNAIEVAK